jgi:hypothetical protein
VQRDCLQVVLVEMLVHFEQASLVADTALERLPERG